MNDGIRSGEAAMRAMFWTWMGIVAAGLADMIAAPLVGR